MLFKYSALNSKREEKNGTIDALNLDVAINTLQRRGLTVTSIDPEKKKTLFSWDMSFFESVSVRDVVAFSRQIATLFNAQVSAVRLFRLLSVEIKNPFLKRTLIKVTDDIQGGSLISVALGKHPKVFSNFYVNMVRAGEESGQLNETFEFLADYLDRSYDLTVKVRNALIYPAFIIVMFIVIIVLMFTLVFPKLFVILIETGQDIPIYTRVVIGISNFFVNYWLVVLIGTIVGGFWFYRFIKTKAGKVYLSNFLFSMPVLGDLFKKFYLARISDVLHTMLTSGIPVVRALEITAYVVNNEIYSRILQNSAQEVRAGRPISETLESHPEMSGIIVQVVKIGEETGEIGNILKTVADFYRREVNSTVDALVGLIEPAIIVVLGLLVGFILTSVLIPIYNISTGI